MSEPESLPPLTGGLVSGRRRTGLVVAVAAPLVATLSIVPWREDAPLEVVLPGYLLLVVTAAVIGGLLSGIISALASFFTVNFFLTEPYHTLSIRDGTTIVQLIVFVVVALAVSAVVEAGARARVAAARHAAESSVLSRLTRSGVGTTTVASVLEQVVQLYELSGAEFVPSADEPVTSVGLTKPPAERSHAVTTAAGSTLRTFGGPTFGDDLRLMQTLADAAERAWRERVLDEGQKVRTAILAAVGHDLRTPLAGIKAAVSGLLSRDVDLSDDDRAELTSTIDTSVDRMSDLVENLLAMSRLEAGTVSVHMEPVSVLEVVSRVALDSTDLVVQVPEDLPLVLADDGLLERVLANLVDNAERHGGGDATVSATRDGSIAEITVADRGPGFPANDSAWGAGHGGLGLTIVERFVDAMDGEFESRSTTDGTTMIVRLKVVS
jgi:K+-sensing histidine kinase KdpD